MCLSRYSPKNEATSPEARAQERTRKKNRGFKADASVKPLAIKSGFERGHETYAQKSERVSCSSIPQFVREKPLKTVFSLYFVHCTTYSPAFDIMCSTMRSTS